jgi:hypothetical protein
MPGALDEPTYDAVLRALDAARTPRLTWNTLAEQTGCAEHLLRQHHGTIDALLERASERLHALWEIELMRAAGATARDASVAERLAAFRQVVAAPAPGGEVVLALDVTRSDGRTTWDVVAHGWLGDVDDEDAVRTDRAGAALRRALHAAAGRRAARQGETGSA